MQRKFFLFFTTILLISCTSSRKAAEPESTVPVSTREIPEYSAEDLAQAKAYYIQGITAFELQDFNEALDNLTMAYILVPDDAAVNFALADAYMFLMDYSNALFYAREAIDIDPSNKWYHIKLAEIYLRDGQTDSAVQALETATRFFPTDVDLLVIKAGTLAEMGDYSASNAVYERILSITGPDLQLYFQMYRNAVMNDDTPAGISILERALAFDKDNAVVIQTLGGLYLEQGENDRALQLFESAIEQGLRSAEIKIGLADVYIQQGQWDMAGRFIREMIEDEAMGEQVKSELIQFMVTQFMRDPSNELLSESTESIIEAYVETYPDNAEAQALAADFFLMMRNNAAAIPRLRETVRLMPENEAAWQQLTQLYYSESMFEELIGISDEAEYWVPEDPFIRFFVGVAYSFSDDKPNAISWLQKATEVPARPNFKSVIWGVLGDTFEGADNWPAAVEAYQQAIELDPENSTALNNYAYFLSIRNEHLEKAYDMSLRAVAIEPSNSSYLDTLGWIYYKKGVIDKAYEYIRLSIQNGGDSSATILEHMGDVYREMGDMENARLWWSRALEQDPERDYLESRLIN
ncbi:MAG: tetratricopeptide repeat protein [Bacteroidetes bacterium]|nr:tetratricopeptide repeat protein [Bacteroidota bacterium]MCH8523580.1 tetratricopeptide repeat protein [Balneolales bacterium]